MRRSVSARRTRMRSTWEASLRTISSSPSYGRISGPVIRTRCRPASAWNDTRPSLSVSLRSVALLEPTESISSTVTYPAFSASPSTVIIKRSGTSFGVSMRCP